MKRTKRKYTRKATTTPIESKSRGIETEDSAIPQLDIVEPTVSFSFTDLPLSVRLGVENTIKLRVRLKLPDDSVERKAQAIKMFRGDKAR